MTVTVTKKTEDKHKDIYELLSYMQIRMKTPKSQNNDFGKYKYRSCEDITNSVKPFLPDGAYLIISDEIVLIGDRFYIKATAKLSYKGNSIETNGFARESLSKKGMDDSQVTGATSSYARKYALNGLFAIDDTKDADATNTHGKTESVKVKEETAEEVFNKITSAISDCNTISQFNKIKERAIARLSSFNADMQKQINESLEFKINQLSQGDIKDV